VAEEALAGLRLGPRLELGPPPAAGEELGEAEFGGGVEGAGDDDIRLPKMELAGGADSTGVGESAPNAKGLLEGVGVIPKLAGDTAEGDGVPKIEVCDTDEFPNTETEGDGVAALFTEGDVPKIEVAA